MKFATLHDWREKKRKNIISTTIPEIQLKRLESVHKNSGNNNNKQNKYNQITKFKMLTRFYTLKSKIDHLIPHWNICRSICKIHVIQCFHIQTGNLQKVNKFFYFLDINVQYIEFRIGFWIFKYSFPCNHTFFFSYLAHYIQRIQFLCCSFLFICFTSLLDV